ncbi:transporter associated domain-containing protein [Demequina litorisediminis]|uniref:transporter associated domain-containing protein n=1 Tax=Demequina litorisediminis TaxID=1849022 RepID=UPI003D67FB17
MAASPASSPSRTRSRRSWARWSTSTTAPRPMRRISVEASTVSRHASHSTSWASLFNIEIEDDDVETAAGLLAKAIGKVPIRGATGTIHGVTLTADTVEGRRRRLTGVIVKAAPQEDEDD